MGQQVVGQKGVASVYAAPLASGLSHRVVTEYLNPGGVALFAQRGIAMRYDHVITAIDPFAKRATYWTPNGAVVLNGGMSRAILPMRVPKAVRNSPLPW